MLQACVNGSRPPEELPADIATPAGLAGEAARAVAAGAACIHLHPKNLAGRDSLTDSDMARYLTALRRACPGVPVGVTTGEWAATDGTPADAVRTWSVLPDFASVNWHEPDADAIATALLARGVAVEAGVWHASGYERWAASEVRARCLRVLLELPDTSDAAFLKEQTETLLRAVRAAEPAIPVLLHGEGDSAWPSVRRAAELGLDTRIGLEDTLRLPDGQPTASNAALVSAALEMLGRRAVSCGGPASEDPR